jgi:hypothetical protein
MNLQQVRHKLHAFHFKELFIEELGWSRPSAARPTLVECGAGRFESRQIALLGGVPVLEITAEAGVVPDAKARAAVHKEIAKHHHENLLIFLDRARTQSMWYWVKRDGAKCHPRQHLYVKGQPGDLFLSKLAAMFVDMSELDNEGNLSVVEAARRVKQALDVEPVTKKFYGEFDRERLRFVEYIDGIDNDRDRHWYASVLLNRLMFIYFLQRKHFLDGGNADYLQDKLAQSKRHGPDRYYAEFLKALFFEGFATPPEKRGSQTSEVLETSEVWGSIVGTVPYLNGGLFLTHPIEARFPGIAIPDVAFENLLALFARYSWNLDDTPGGNDNEINPDVLGYIFEKYINQKAFGAYYTRTEITEYLCEQTIHRLILDRMNTPGVPAVAPQKTSEVSKTSEVWLVPPRQFDSLPDLLLSLDAPLCRRLLLDVLPSLTLLDPACGSGAFLVAAMKTLVNVYGGVIGRIEFLNDTTLTDWLRRLRAEHASLNYYVKKRIIIDNLFGVDIMEEATEIALLRLFLTLVSSVETVEQLEPLPNIDFNILPGHSLIGLLRVDEAEYDRRSQQRDLFRKSYREVVGEKNRLVRSYRDATSYAQDLCSLRDTIQQHRAKANEHLNDLLWGEIVMVQREQNFAFEGVVTV